MDNLLLAVATLLATAPILYFIFKKNGDEKLDTKNSGNITLFAETSCKQVVEALVNAFQAANPNAHIELRSGADKDAYEALLNDTSRMVVLPRGLSEKEKQVFSARYFTPPSIEFARDLKTNNLVRPLVLFNNQARNGLGNAFMAFVTSEAGNQVVKSMGLEPVKKKTGMLKAKAKVA